MDNDRKTGFRAVHPGETLREELKERGIKQKELAAKIGILPSHLNEAPHYLRTHPCNTIYRGKIEVLEGGSLSIITHLILSRARTVSPELQFLSIIYKH